MSQQGVGNDVVSLECRLVSLPPLGVSGLQPKWESLEFTPVSLIVCLGRKTGVQGEGVLSLRPRQAYSNEAPPPPSSGCPFFPFRQASRC